MLGEHTIISDILAISTYQIRRWLPTGVPSISTCDSSCFPQCTDGVSRTHTHCPKEAGIADQPLHQLLDACLVAYEIARHTIARTGQDSEHTTKYMAVASCTLAILVELLRNSALDARSSLAAMTPKDVVKAIETHAHHEHRLGLTSSMEDSLSKAMPTLVNRLRSLRPSMDEVTELLEFFSDGTCCFPLEQRQELARIVETTMIDPTTATSRSSAKTQVNVHLQNYLPSRLWACLESCDSKHNKMRHLAQFMCQHLGLRNPCALTKRLSWAISITLHDMMFDIFRSPMLSER